MLFADFKIIVRDVLDLNSDLPEVRIPWQAPLPLKATFRSAYRAIIKYSPESWGRLNQRQTIPKIKLPCRICQNTGQSVLLQMEVNCDIFLLLIYEIRQQGLHAARTIGRQAVIPPSQKAIRRSREGVVPMLSTLPKPSGVNV